MEYNGVTISWLGHASFLLEHGEKKIYIDPYNIGRTRPDADLILITHDHYDHLSVEDIDNVVSDETIIIAPESCREKLEDLPGKLRIISVGKDAEVLGYVVSAVAAYNTNKKFHPKENGWVGYIIDFGDATVYHSGDTDVIDEMKELSVDVALLPVSGVYVMTPKEAAQAAVLVNAKKVVPMHYGSIVGDSSHAEQLCELLGKKAVILEKA